MNGLDERAERLRMHGLMAPQIGPKSWLQEERFARFREAYAYASHRSNAVPGLSRVSPEDAYYIWLYLDRGMRRQDVDAVARGRAAFERLQDDLWSMPAMAGLDWPELPSEVQAMWVHAVDE